MVDSAEAETEGLAVIRSLRAHVWQADTEIKPSISRRARPPGAPQAEGRYDGRNDTVAETFEQRPRAMG